MHTLEMPVQAPCANGMSVKSNLHQQSSSSGNDQMRWQAANAFTWLTLPGGPSRTLDKCPELGEAEKADRLVCLELNVQKLLSQLLQHDTLQDTHDQPACREAIICSTAPVQRPSGTTLWSIKYRPAATADGTDSDDSTVGDSKQRQSAMLLIGPVGSGKTSLVYSAAQEVGMRVVEINSDCRAKGSCISAVVGEAMQSCSLHLSALAASDAVASAFAEEKSLILLEELDVQAEMDTSLMAPLAKLIGRSKRPVVITCNTTDNLSLSSYIAPLQLPLHRPSTQSSLQHLVLVAVCEGICTNVATLSQLIEEAAGTGDKRQAEQKLSQSGICSGAPTLEQAAHILSALDVCTGVLNGRHAVYNVPSGYAEAADATGVTGYKSCANVVDAQTAFESANARQQSSESAAANVAAAVWPDTIVRESTVARVERLAWLRSMAKSTQISTTQLAASEQIEDEHRTKR
ncbi:MAG: ATPase AAA [Trebouxia sp. A1-2]|nr:MAG: ATPase AAA [Trebouxia sp. A1-2]